jgi:hypothetical protein
MNCPRAFLPVPIKERYFHTDDAAGVFDPEGVRVLAAALDDAWRQLQTAGVFFKSRAQAEAARELLAKQIIKSAQAGERDQNRLRKDALVRLANSNLAQRAPKTTGL